MLVYHESHPFEAHAIARKHRQKLCRFRVIRAVFYWSLNKSSSSRKPTFQHALPAETSAVLMQSMPTPYTARQGQFLSFIYHYIQVNGQPPSEMDMQRHFRVTPPSIHQMILTLEKRGLIERTPGQARSIRLLLPPEQLSSQRPTKEGGDQKLESILGDWRITHMEMWDQDFVDAEVEGYVRLDHGRSGEFHFGYVHGWIDHDLTERDGKPAAEWSWEGNDEMDPASGRGWVVLQENGTIEGKLLFHRGDRLDFVAVRRGKPTPHGRKRAPIPLNKPKRSKKS